MSMSGFERVVLHFGLVLFLLPPASSAQPTASTGAAEAHVGKGYQYEQQERYEEAAREFQAALTANPGLMRARYQLAVCYFALGRRPEARQEFQRVRSETGGNPSVTYYLGRLDLLEGDFDSARRRLESVAADPPFPDTAYYLGSACLKQNDLQAAERWLRKAAQLDSRDFRIPDRLARIYQKRGRRAEAETEYTRSEELRQRYDQAARQAVSCSRELETRAIAQARATCQQLFDANDPDKLTTLGMLYGQHGDYADAVAPLALAAQLDAESPEIQHNLGLTYFRLKRYREARSPLERAAALRPDFFGSSALLGAALYALKQDEAAYPVLDHAHELNPEDSDTAKLLFNVALFLAQKELAGKAYAESVNYLRKAVELRPADAEVHRELAQVYASLGQRAQAELEKREAERLSGH